MTNIEKRQSLIDRFIYWNNQINLSAIRNPEDIYKKHILDSLEINKVFEFEKWKICIDVWTWWWFPLLPVAISNPQCNFVWLDSTQKKIKAVQDTVNHLWIWNVTTIWWRAENQLTKYDYVMARSVAYIDKLWNNISNLWKKWTIIILYKMLSEEHNDIIKLCWKHNLNSIKEHKYTLPQDEVTRVIYIIRKG